MPEMKIIKECSKGYKLATRARLYTNFIYDQIVFLDRTNGSDGNDGESWSTPVNTINGAMDKIWGGSNSTARGRHFAVIFRSRLTGGTKSTANEVIDIQGVHLIGAGVLYGMGGGWDSCFVTDNNALTADSDLTGLSATKVGLRVDADDVLISGLKFYAPTDYTTAFYHVALNDAHGGRNCAVINNVFQGDVNGTRSFHGVGINGSETALVAGNQFYFHDEGVTVGGGETRYASQCVIEDNRFFGCKYGIRTTNASTVMNEILNNYFTQQSTYGWAMTRGIDLTYGTGFLCANNIVGHATEGTAFAYGTGNFWINNYHSGSGGTLGNPDA